MKFIIFFILAWLTIWQGIALFHMGNIEKKVNKLENNVKSPFTDLPEEIQIAEKGDTLIVYKTTKDTIFIGFKNQ